MSKINVVVVVDSSNVGSMIESLGNTGMAESIQVMADGGTKNGVAYAATLPTSGNGVTDPGPVNTSTVRRTVRRVGSGVASKVLMPVPRMTPERAAKARKLTPIEDRVAAVVFRHAKKGGIPEAGIVKELGNVNFHSVSGAVFSLRGAKGAKPAIIASVPIGTK